MSQENSKMQTNLRKGLQDDTVNKKVTKCKWFDTMLAS